ncbi:hypothetical protein B0H11DRAFT_1988091 [Mycena galericulata]|nr:hypothetical protein B0H11DRAFT_1988091 [Mycena galericulata]
MTSPGGADLHKLLRSNEYPSHFQAAHCQAIASSSPAELERYDVEILRLKTALRIVELQRATVEDYARLCSHILSPIRRLPSEIWIEIFDLFIPEHRSSGSVDSLDISDDFDAAVATEMKRIANVDLLRMSRVCVRWRYLIMGTPSLWSFIDLDLALWSDARMLDLLKSVLDRGDKFPLDLRTHGREIVPPQALELIAQYSGRWKKVALSLSRQTEYLSAIKGNLPLLEHLLLDLGPFDSGPLAAAPPFFEFAPRLRDFQFRGPSAALAKFPLEQLERFSHLDVLPQELDDTIPVMARLAGGTSFYIRVRLDQFAVEGEANSPPPVTSHVSALLVCGAGLFDPDVARLVLAIFCKRLSLPLVQSLKFAHSGYYGLPMPWPTVEFLALSHRSSFHAHLKDLELQHLAISEAELLQTLSSLQSLEHLVISDHRAARSEGSEMLLITDSLLNRLTWTPDPTHLGCHTLLEFDDAVYRDFVLSRAALYCDLDYYRELDPAILAQFEELQLRDELWFTIEANNWLELDEANA